MTQPNDAPVDNDPEYQDAVHQESTDDLNGVQLADPASIPFDEGDAGTTEVTQ